MSAQVACCSTCWKPLFTHPEEDAAGGWKQRKPAPVSDEVDLVATKCGHMHHLVCIRRYWLGTTLPIDEKCPFCFLPFGIEGYDFCHLLPTFSQVSGLEVLIDPVLAVPADLVDQSQAEPDVLVDQAPVEPDALVDQAPAEPDILADQVPSEPAVLANLAPAEPDVLANQVPAEPDVLANQAPAVPDDFAVLQAIADVLFDQAPAMADVLVDKAPAVADVSVDQAPAMADVLADPIPVVPAAFPAPAPAALDLPSAEKAGEYVSRAEYDKLKRHYSREVYYRRKLEGLLNHRGETFSAVMTSTVEISTGTKSSQNPPRCEAQTNGVPPFSSALGRSNLSLTVPDPSEGVIIRKVPRFNRKKD